MRYNLPTSNIQMQFWLHVSCCYTVYWQSEKGATRSEHDQLVSIYATKEYKNGCIVKLHILHSIFSMFYSSSTMGFLLETSNIQVNCTLENISPYLTAWQVNTLMLLSLCTNSLTHLDNWSSCQRALLFSHWDVSNSTQLKWYLWEKHEMRSQLATGVTFEW